VKRSAEVVIIGGGVIGCSIAYHLSKEKVDVVVLERDHLGSGASGRCGGMIWAKWYPMASSELMARVSMMTLDKYAVLEDELDADIEYNLEKSIACVRPGEEADYEVEIRELARFFGARLEFIGPDEIKTLAPYIGIDNIEPVGGYLHTGHKSRASANPFLTVHALARGAARLGATFHTGTEVTDIVVERGRVEGVRTGKGDVSSRIVINAAGAWSADVGRMCGMRIPTRPFSEEAVVTEPLDTLPYMPMLTDVYGRQTRNGQILIGENPLPEQESSYSTEVSLDFLPRISDFLLQMFPSFGNLSIQRQWAGVEDVTPDGLPILSEAGKVDGLILACGLGAGFCLSQATGEIIADIILKRDGTRDMAKALGLDRFDKKYREYPGRWYD